MATARQAMLANLRGRFDEATELIAGVAKEGPRAGLLDTYRVVASVQGEIAFYGGTQADPGMVDQLRAMARRLPGHFIEAGIAVCLVLTGRTGEAQTELDRMLPAVLAGSGPRQLGSAAGPVLDDAARDAYRDRIRGLDSELSAADRAGDSVSAGRIHNERQTLVAELRRATGLAGRPRRASADAERARVNVTRTLRAAIARITRAAPIA